MYFSPDVSIFTMQPKETSRIETNQADAKTKADLMSKDTVQLRQAGLRADNKHAQKRSTDQTLKQAEARLETDKTKQVASKSTDQAPKLVDADKTKQSVSKSTDKTSKEVDTKLETDETKQRAYKQSIGQTPKLAELKSDVDRNKRDTASSFTGQSPIHAEARSETGKTKYVPSREAGQTLQQAEVIGQTHKKQSKLGACNKKNNNKTMKNPHPVFTDWFPFPTYKNILYCLYVLIVMRISQYDLGIHKKKYKKAKI